MGTRIGLTKLQLVLLFAILLTVVWNLFLHEALIGPRDVAPPFDPSWRTSASLSLSARSNKCKSAAASYEIFESKGGHSAAQDTQAGRWLLDFALSDPDPNKVIVSIGCNAGDDLMSVLSLWNKAYWDVERFVALWHKLGNVHGGTVNDLAKHAPKPAEVTGADHTIPSAICVEANLRGFEALENVSHQMGFDKPHGGWERPMRVLNLAVSNTSGSFFEFPMGAPGAWWEGLDSNKKNWNFRQRLWHGLGSLLGLEKTRKRHRVPVKTADDILLGDPGLSGTDLLLFSDINGYDALVLFGLANTFATGRVQYIEFEFDPRGDWMARPLSEVILFLDSFELDCFLPLKAGLHRITGCWDHRFDRLPSTWINIVCFNRKNERWPPIIKKWSSYKAES